MAEKDVWYVPDNIMKPIPMTSSSASRAYAAVARAREESTIDTPLPKRRKADAVKIAIGPSRVDTKNKLSKASRGTNRQRTAENLRYAHMPKENSGKKKAAVAKAKTKTNSGTRARVSKESKVDKKNPKHTERALATIVKNLKPGTHLSITISK